MMHEHEGSVGEKKLNKGHMSIEMQKAECELDEKKTYDAGLHVPLKPVLLKFLLHHTQDELACFIGTTGLFCT